MDEALVAYLEEQQTILRLSARAMADRLGVSESHWSKIRCTRRRLPRNVFNRAVVEFPGLLEVVRACAQREQVPA